MEKSYRAELVGVFGDPIDENPTGVVEEAAFAALGLNYRYITVRVQRGELAAAVQGLRAFHMRGINLTIPHKVEVLQYLDSLSEAAQLCGAVNVVVNEDGQLWGDNTDGKGYLKSLVDAGVDAYALIAPVMSSLVGREEELLRAIAETGVRTVFHDPLNLRNVDTTRLDRMGIGPSPKSRRRLAEAGRDLGLDVWDSFENRRPDVWHLNRHCDG